MKIWVLSYALPEGGLCKPFVHAVFKHRLDAMHELDVQMRAEWENAFPQNEHGDNPSYPGSPEEALGGLCDYYERNLNGDEPWGAWDISEHEI